MMALFKVFPLLAIPVILYNLISAGVDPSGVVQRQMPDGTYIGNVMSAMVDTLDNVAFSIPMMGEKVHWEVANGDLLIILSIGLLFAEILKSTSTGTATIMNHAVSMLLFIVCLVEFLLFPNFATSVFFIITMMTLLDVLAGVVVTIVSARRDFGVAGDI